MEKLGKYEIVDKIGVGGFGVVYRGYDPFIKRHVAIKTCSADDRETRDRFMREAEIAGNLQHRHIVTVFEFGFHGEVPYLVQEFLSGEDLDHKIRRGDAIPIAEKVRWLTEVARGLEFAHSRGVVHRDIKPANIRILDDGSAKILDFGIAKLAQQQSNLTQVGVTLGTASYLAPEQIRGEAVDVRTDIFSFGVLSYELLTYERPFRAQEISATFYKILNDKPATMSIKAPGTPPELERIVLRCLEKDPAQRYSPTSELVQALERLDRRSSTTFRTSGEHRQSGGAAEEVDEKTSALKPMSLAATASRPIPIPEKPPERPAPAPVNPQQPTIALGEMVLETPKSGARPESYGMSPASLGRAGRRSSRWPKVVGGTLAALVVVAAALVLAGPSIPGFDRFLASLSGDASKPSTAADAPAEPPSEPKLAKTSGGATPAQPAPAVAAQPVPPAPAPAPTAGTAGGQAPSVVAPVEPAPAPAPVPEPPKPGVLVIGPAWDPSMTVRVGGSQPYRLDRERRIELEAATVRLQFQLENPSYQFEKELRVKLGAGATERVSIPIEKPGRLTVQPHLNSRPGSVRIDGQLVGTAPVRGRWVEPGEHFVEILAIGGGGVAPALARSITVKSDVETILSFDVDGKLEPTLREKPVGGQ